MYMHICICIYIYIYIHACKFISTSSFGRLLVPSVRFAFFLLKPMGSSQGMPAPWQMPAQHRQNGLLPGRHWRERGRATSCGLPHAQLLWTWPDSQGLSGFGVKSCEWLQKYNGCDFCPPRVFLYISGLCISVSNSAFVILRKFSPYPTCLQIRSQNECNINGKLNKTDSKYPHFKYATTAKSKPWM